MEYYRECGKMAKKSASSKAHKALVILEDYVNGTIMQTLAVQNAKEASFFGANARTRIAEAAEDGMAEHDIPIEYLKWLLQVHLLLICIDKVQNLLHYIVREDTDPKL